MYEPVQVFEFGVATSETQGNMQTKFDPTFGNNQLSV